ncbi:hypothetical protein PF010_g16526 [Phytophthora fragariae]|uniref:Uncharacterized protein n=1 Tax=Phytophthora fragariae TaxID=53985 RepID=A0A6A3Y3N9_9STRA|nr:hypothetical protein PF003_g7580 [Phytophthora fragariae]KAE8959364.1 hypothetical protein PF011_g30458 [Phytophthora fragariae]KAE9095914.1 hypothetical protein PF010_g16526 [Phytophthora fragariae]KAE9163973.1 hypothetical protein PF004_g29980 [Phytophthora fragariae]KAE9211366.1 hypothetical protein PF002_g18547 [Phytophthora fragariae]
METNDSPQFIDPRDYLSESSSEVDMREVNPMDELSDFEEEEEEMDKNVTVCEVCKSSERESDIVLQGRS